MGEGWSIAWRVHDAQFWGVPQRRKRIALVADFGGDTAPEILFERKSVSGDIETSGEEREGTATTSERNANPSSFTLKIRGGVEVDSKGKKAGKGPLIQTELSGTLGVSQDQTLITKCISVDEKMGQTYVGDEVSNTLGARDYKQPQAVVYGISGYESNAMKSSNPNSGIYEANTTRTLDNNGGNPACNQGGMAVVQGFDGYNQSITGNVAMPLRAKAADNEHVPIVLEGNGTRPSHKGDGYTESDTMYTLNSTEQHGVCTYQKTTGPLCPGAHAGSYNGQDAYNDMLVIGGGAEPITTSKAGFFLNARSDGIADTLVATDYKDPQRICYGLDRASFNQGQNAKYGFSVEEEIAQTLVSKGPGGY